jgi:transglutaminase-like putative cysteine protease
MLMLWAATFVVGSESTETRVRVVETVALPQPSSAKTSRVWIPVPYDADGQALTSLRIPKGFRLTRDPKTGNRFLYGEYSDSPPETIEVEYTVRRHSLGVPEPNSLRAKPPKTMFDVWRKRDSLAEDRTIDARATEAIGDAKDGFERAKRIYLHVFDKMSYAADDAGWGKGDAARACRVGRGNCTDFHALFVALCHASGIPARLEMGISLPATGSQYHCWASFYDESRGWIPVDVSQAKRRYTGLKSPTEADRLTGFGKLDANRIGFGRGIDVPLAPAARNGVRFALFPIVEIDGARAEHGDPKAGGVGVEFRSTVVKEQS